MPWNQWRMYRRRNELRREAAALTTYLICSTHRTGSSLLCQLLGDTGLCGKPDEFFSPAWAPRFARELAGGLRSHPDVESRVDGGGDAEPMHLDYARYLRSLYGQRATPNGVWGCKIQWSHTRRVWEAFQHRSLQRMDDKGVFRLFKEVFGQPKYLWIRRRDKVRQAISFWKSKQTNVYTKWRPAPSENAKPVFDFGKIQGFVERFHRQDEAWGRLLERNGAQPLVLVYEEFSQRLEETVRQAMDHLGVERPTRLQVPRPRLEKLSDQLNEEWYERYHSMLSRGDVPQSSNRDAAPVRDQV